MCYKGGPAGRPAFHYHCIHSHGGPTPNPFLMEGTRGKPGPCWRPKVTVGTLKLALLSLPDLGVLIGLGGLWYRLQALRRTHNTVPSTRLPSLTHK